MIGIIIQFQCIKLDIIYPADSYQLVHQYILSRVIKINKSWYILCSILVNIVLLSNSLHWKYQTNDTLESYQCKYACNQCNISNDEFYTLRLCWSICLARLDFNTLNFGIMFEWSHCTIWIHRRWGSFNLKQFWPIDAIFHCVPRTKTAGIVQDTP